MGIGSLTESAQVRWSALKALHLVVLVCVGARFEGGDLVEQPDGHVPPAAGPSSSCGASYAQAWRNARLAINANSRRPRATEGVFTLDARVAPNMLEDYRESSWPGVTCSPTMVLGASGSAPTAICGSYWTSGHEEATGLEASFPAPSEAAGQPKTCSS